MAKPGRPSSYSDTYPKQAEKLCRLGATDQEIADFFERSPTEDDWLTACVQLIRQDRGGVIAARKKKRAAQKSARRQRDPSCRLVEATRARLWAALKGKTDGRLFSRLGFSRADLIAHLEQRFADGMTWRNYGAWHVDHIRPCASFNQADPAQFAECWSLGNLQPLWASENVRKGAAYGAA